MTLGDIAKELGVSTATVSMALNGTPGSRIPEATVKKVKRTARKLDYRPNNSARALKTGRTGTIGFISNEVTLTRFASPMIQGILDRADAVNYAVMMTETERSRSRLSAACETLEHRSVDAMVVGLMNSSDIVLPPLSTPTVVCNGTADGHTAVLPDEFAAGGDAVRYLLDRGHRDIAVIGRYPAGQPASFNISQRFAGMDAALAEAGLTFSGEYAGTVWEPELGFEATLSLLDDHVPTAILAANDRVAFGVYQALTERGLEVPNDISVLSFDDEDLAALLRPGLTTFRLPYKEMGERAAEIAVAFISDQTPLEENPVFLPLNVVERGSVSTVW